MADHGNAPDTSRTRRSRLVAGALLVLSFVLLYAATLAIAGSRTLLRTDRFVAVVDSSLEEPEVQAAIAEFVAAKLTEVVEAAGLVDDLLPERFDPLRPILERSIEDIVARQTETVVSSQLGRELMSRAVAGAHRSALAVLDGDPTESALVDVDDGVVRIDLLPLAIGVAQRLAEAGIAFEDLEVTTGAPRSTQLDELGSTLGTVLDDDFATFVVYEDTGSVTSALGTARRALELFRKAIWLLVATTVLVAVATVLASASRLRTMLLLAAAGLLATALARATLSWLAGAIPRSQDATASRAGDVLLESLVADLERTVTVMALATLAALGLVLWLLSRAPTQDATWLDRGASGRTTPAG